jgi:hypothetical protein
MLLDEKLNTGLQAPWYKQVFQRDMPDFMSYRKIKPAVP